MNLLIVGASSFIGRKIYQYAKSLPDINVVGTATNPQNEWLKFDLQFDDINQVLEDSCLLNRYQNGEKIYVIIAAFFCDNSQMLDNINKAEKINIIGMKKMLDVFHQKNIKFLFISSEQVFSGTKAKCYKETDQVFPVLIYGEHKARLERYIMDNMPENLIYRLSQSIDIHPDGKHILGDLYRRYLLGERHFKAIRGQVFSPTYVGDTAKWILEGLKRNLTGIYHCTNPESISRGELMRRFLNSIAQDVDIEEVPLEYFHFKERRPLDIRLDITKIKSQIPEISFWTIDEIIESFVKNLHRSKINDKYKCTRGGDTLKDSSHWCWRICWKKNSNKFDTRGLYSCWRGASNKRRVCLSHSGMQFS